MKIIPTVICLSIISSISLYAMEESEQRRIQNTQKLCETLSSFPKTTQLLLLEQKDLPKDEDTQEVSDQDLFRLPKVKLVVSKNNLLRAVWPIESDQIYVYEQKTWGVLKTVMLGQEEKDTLKDFFFNDAEDTLVFYYGEGKEKHFAIKIPIDVYSTNLCTIQ